MPFLRAGEGGALGTRLRRGYEVTERKHNQWKLDE